MRNNRLIIEYNASPRTTLIREGEKESLKCNSIERAREIVKNRPSHIVKGAQFSDSYGIQTKIK